MVLFKKLIMSTLKWAFSIDLILFKETTVEVLEIGFGTALNAMLTFTEGINRSIITNYTAYEAYPVLETELKALDYESMFPSNYIDFFKKMHSVSWNEFFEIAPHFFK